jgi:hypothetical protein
MTLERLHADLILKVSQGGLHLIDLFRIRRSQIVVFP